MMFADLSDKQLASMALNMWACHIETGKVNVSAQDAEKMGEPVKALSLDQMALIVRIRRLSQRLAVEGAPGAHFPPGTR